MKTIRRAYTWILMTVDDAQEVCGDRSVLSSLLSDYPARNKV